jgi:hypothetical protein
MTETQQQMAKAAGDVSSISILVGTLADWLPAVAALFTIIWTGLRISETDTCRKWIRKKRKGK